MINDNQSKISSEGGSNVLEAADDYITFQTPVIFNLDNIQNLELCEEDFKSGVSDVSRLCGQISALVSIGISPELALSYLADKESTNNINEYNYKISKINAESNVNSAKYGQMSISRMTI